ncbi:DUF58 domain-containing protein [Paenibacillus lutrae]|uniref:DUF58 domain-containing protein n=1 Tax=Paenibacillus lutrae TaxID=2078573 RepID=A0A7X3JZ25_9BACL|nr:DUF58 domain-containing protein [Paenibacillus lutrae]MVO99738.1 DUF58 domain-containing protein [Paenibacillus lutrae]
MIKSWLVLSATILGALAAHAIYLSIGGIAPFLVEALLWCNACSGAAILLFTLNGAVLDREIHVSRLTAGQTAQIRLHVKHRSFLPVCWLAVREYWQHEERGESICITQLCFPWFRRTIPMSYGIEHIQRGHYTLMKSEVISGDLFGLFVKRVQAAGKARLTVYPAPAESLSRVLTVSRLENETWSREASLLSAPVYAGSRAYISGDPMSWIDWKATARAGTLQTQVRAASVKLSRMVILDPDPHCGEGSTACRCGFATHLHKGRKKKRPVKVLSGKTQPLRDEENDEPWKKQSWKQRTNLSKITNPDEEACRCGFGLLEKRISLAVSAVTEPGFGARGIVVGTAFRERTEITGVYGQQPSPACEYPAASSGTDNVCASAPLELLASLRGEKGRGLLILQREHASLPPGIGMTYLTSRLDKGAVMGIIALLAARRPVEVVFIHTADSLSEEDLCAAAMLRDAGAAFASIALSSDFHRVTTDRKGHQAVRENRFAALNFSGEGGAGDEFARG